MLVVAAAAAAVGVVIPMVVFKSTPAAADDSAQTPGPEAGTGDTLTALLSKFPFMAVQHFGQDQRLRMRH